jgi:hypothetical protein
MWYQKRLIKSHTQVKLYKIIVVFANLYGSVIWILKRSDIRVTDRTNKARPTGQTYSHTYIALAHGLAQEAHQKIISYMSLS